MPTIAVYGGSFNPPCAHHRAVAEAVLQHFDRLVVVTSGFRPDAVADAAVEPTYRAAMVDLTFSALPRTQIDAFDLEQATFTRNDDLHARYTPQGEVWHVVGSDLIAGGAGGTSLVQTRWRNGGAMFREANFAVVSRPGHEVAAEDLPPRHRLIRVDAEGSAAQVRESLYLGEPVGDRLVPLVADYVRRHALYTGRPPARVSRLDPFDPRCLLFADPRNKKAAAIAERCAKSIDDQNPNCVLVIGGDGTMLRAIREHWRRRLPFFGINAGTLGFLLNDPEELAACDDGMPTSGIVARQMPMIYVEALGPDGVWREALSFNDAWVERSTAQTAWLRLTVNGRERIPKLVCDGVLFSTAAGSTAYAMSMGATPLLADTPGWLVVGSNVMSPMGWKTALLPLETVVELEVLNPEKRPVKAFAYGDDLGEVRALRARISRNASVELAFMPQHDLAEKIARVQFPTPNTARL